MVAQPVAEDAGLEFAQAERPMRGGARRSGGSTTAGGPGIGIVIPLAVTVVATVIVAIGGFMVAGTSAKAVDRALETTAIGVAQSLAAMEPDWWHFSHGTEKTVYEVLTEKKEEKIRKEKAKGEDFDDRDVYVINTAFKEFTEKWDITEPDSAQLSKRSDIQSANRARLSKLTGIEGTSVVYAAVYQPNANSPMIKGGSSPDDLLLAPERPVGKATVANGQTGGSPAKLVTYPMTDAFGNDGGKVKVLVVARGAKAGAGATVAILALVTLLLVGGTSFGLCLAASKGLSNLARELEQVARGDLDVRIRAGGGEVGAVARSADRALKTFLKVQEQSIMSATVQPVAAPVQSFVDTAALLPSEPPRLDGYEIEAVHKPSPAGANDFYDYIQIDDNHLGIVIADMPTAGPDGSFIATTFRAVMRANAMGDTSPASVLSKVNRVMAGELKRGDHITAMYTVLDLANGIVSVASAGHLPLVFWKLEKKGSALLNPEGIAIGLDKGPVFEKTVVDKRIKLSGGDRYVLYTDGPVAAKNMNGEEFGEQRFYYVVSREAPKNSAAFVNFVANEVDLFHEGAIQEDDITLVTVRKV